jgi:hypothetical protein
MSRRSARKDATVHARPLILLVVGLVAAGLTGCGSSAPPIDPNAPVVLVSAPGDSTSGAAAQIMGPLTLDQDRCAGVDGHLAIWPDGTAWDSEADALKLPDGSRVRVGDVVSGGGGYEAGTSAQRALADTAQRDQCSWDGETAIFNPSSDVTTGT